MSNPIIKICGIRDIETARNAALSGANLIGMIFHASSPRNVSPVQAISLSHAIKNAGASPVAIFVDQNDHEMWTICENADIQIVQLHGDISRSHHHLLPDEYQRIYTLNVGDEGNLVIDHGFQHLNTKRDMILVDHHEAGHGKMINYTSFTYHYEFPWILAGGLTANNVISMITKLKPDGVDVSSGVEISRGKKDMGLIQQFVNTVRGYHEA